MIRPCKPKWIERKKYETLSSSSKNVGSEKNYQGAGRFSPPPPFVCFSATQNCSDWCLSLVFVLSIHFGLQGLSKITFWGTWTYSAIHLPCKLRHLVALWGQQSKKNGYLQIQGRMQIFEKKSQSALNHVLIG